MKRLISVFLACFIISSCNESIFVQGENVTNKVLIEAFSNYRCPYCPPADSVMDLINNKSNITIRDMDVIMIRYHSTLYAGDPFYEFNPQDNFARQSYYNAGSANPRGFLNGANLGVYDESKWKDSLNNHLKKLNTFHIDISNSYDNSSRIGSVNVSIRNITSSEYQNIKLHIAVIEDEINYSAPNGTIVFNNILRDLITPNEGRLFNISANNYSEIEVDYSLDSIINAGNCSIVVFVQDDSDKKVLGVNKIFF